MGSMVSFTSSRVAEVVQEDRQPLGADQVRIHTLFSGISAGTELTAYRGSNPYLNKRWDEDRRLFVDGSTSFEYPVNGWGYEEVGEVVEIGSDVTRVKVGDRIWGTWGHRSETIQTEARAADRILSPTVDPRIGIFSQIGAIALNVILDADIHVGETVVVFGLGVPGQIVAQLARLNGAHVIGVDGIAARRELALELGIHEVLDPSDGEVAERVRAKTGGRGADVCLEVTGNYHAMHEAIRTVAYSSRVCVAGFMQGEGTGLRLGEEFHHNRVAVIASQISGVAPALQHRWNEYRLASTAMRLAEEGKLKLADLISHELPVAEAGFAFTMLDTKPQEALQVVLTFEEN
ncbi:zinc-binding alcohol dehydrogenase [Leifsonia poae]|uniref:Oxidoreductase n=2 Tax=Leifsonia poae TaxID=110933 RepID=A0A9W6M0R9_9MICO|nr:oxidoreductase [Leifsonia poae]